MDVKASPKENGSFLVDSNLEERKKKKYIRLKQIWHSHSLT
jgi:hypothetical protein